MADIIDRQKAIDAIAEFLFYTSNFDGMRQGFDLSDWKWKIEGVLSDLPSSQPTQTNTPNTLDALDCVSREAVMDLIIETDPYWAEGMTRAIYNGVSKMPSAQPVLIRCKDCKHRDPEDKKCDSGHFILWQLPRDDDWFCADAERRTDD